MNKMLICIFFFNIYDLDIFSQCQSTIMQDSSLEYFEQLCYTQETPTGFRTYMRKFYETSTIDDPRNGIYIQERDACLKLISESMFLRNVELRNRVFHPKDYLFLYPSLNPDYFWVVSGYYILYYNYRLNTYSINNFDQGYDVGNFNFFELENNKFYLSPYGSILTLEDSVFKVQKRIRGLRSNVNRLKESKVLFKFEPFQLPLWTEDSSIILTDIDGNEFWTYRYPGVKTPFFYDSDFDETNYYLIGVADPDGNKVAYNPVVYKLDKQGQFIKNKIIETNVFKAAEATKCIFAHNYLFVAGWQTISRKKVERANIWFAKLDTDLNIIWKKDWDLKCGPVNSEFRKCIPTSDGGVLFALTGNTYKQDSCNPILIKLDGNGNIYTNISEFQNQQIEIYPNPVQDILYLKAIEANSIKSFRMYDLTGKNYTFELQGNEINLSNLPPGMYFLSIELSDHRKVIKRIIKY